MMMVSRLISESSGLNHLSNPEVHFPIQKFKRTTFLYSNSVRFVSGRISGRHIQCSLVAHSQIKCAASSGRNYQELRFDEGESRSEPYWLILIKEAYWALRSLLAFLVEQPGQLRYIEWPSFQSTLKTATLTLVLVALLIVALSSIDSVLCYLLAWLLRKSA